MRYEPFEIELNVSAQEFEKIPMPLGWSWRPHAAIRGISILTLECGAISCRAALAHALIQLDAVGVSDPFEVTITRRPKPMRAKRRAA